MSESPKFEQLQEMAAIAWEVGAADSPHLTAAALWDAGYRRVEVSA